jgi:APA family basic amino acid/polyamine antiporter
VAPTWSNLAIAVPVAMLAYTGVETVSNLAEEVRDPVKNVPNAYRLVALAVFAIYFTLPLIALSALPVHMIDGELTTLLALPPDQGGYANDPILGVVKNLGVEGTLLDALEIYVGILAATILFIATNAGVIGASRITYSMATYRQIPEVFRRLHPRFKTPWLSIVLFAGVAPIAVILPGDVEFVGTLYSFGATLSFTVAHASLVRMRMRPDGEELLYRARPNLRVRGVDWPLFAIFGGIATGISFAVIVVQNPTTRWVGLGWITVGLLLYVAYRRRVVRASVTETVKAPPAYGPALALEYRRLLVPVLPGRASDEALDVAAGLAAERGSYIVAVTVLEVPLDLPLAAELPDEEALANHELDEARAIGASYGVDVVPRLLRDRNAGKALVAEAERRGTEIIVLGAPRKDLSRGKRAVFGRTVDYVLKHAPCRVLVTAVRKEAA